MLFAQASSIVVRQPCFVNSFHWSSHMTRLITMLAALVLTFTLVSTATAQLPATTLVAAPTTEDVMTKKTADQMAPIPPVQPSLIRGWLDDVDFQYPFDERRFTFGWALHLAAPNQQIPVRLYEGRNTEGRVIETLITSVMRPDVNAAFTGFNVTGEHGFQTTVPEHLCNGKERVIHAYGVDPFTNAEVELAGSPQTLLCAPKDGNRWIQGTVKNKRFGFPMSTQDYFGVNMTASRVDEEGNKFLYNYTNCESWNGCVDSGGTFMFFHDINGNQPVDGDYILVVRARDHVEKTIRFTIPMTGHLEIELDIVPVSVQLIDHSLTVSKHGGTMWAKVRIINYESRDDAASVDSVVQGPTLTREWDQYEIHRTYGLSAPWTHYEMWVEIPIDGQLPNGHFWASVRVGKAHSKIEPYQDVWFMTKKR